MAHPIYFEIDSATVVANASRALRMQEEGWRRTFQFYEAEARARYNRAGIGGWFTRLAEHDEAVYIYGRMLRNKKFQEHKLEAQLRQNELFNLYMLPNGVDRVMISTEDAFKIGIA